MTINLAKRHAWTLVYEDSILGKGFFWTNAGDPPTYSPAPKWQVKETLSLADHLDSITLYDLTAEENAFIENAMEKEIL